MHRVHVDRLVRVQMLVFQPLSEAAMPREGGRDSHSPGTFGRGQPFRAHALVRHVQLETHRVVEAMGWRVRARFLQRRRRGDARFRVRRIARARGQVVEITHCAARFNGLK